MGGCALKRTCRYPRTVTACRRLAWGAGARPTPALSWEVSSRSLCSCPSANKKERERRPPGSVGRRASHWGEESGASPGLRKGETGERAERARAFFSLGRNWEQMQILGK